MALDNLDEITDPRELIRLAKQYEYGMAQRGALLDRAVAAADRLGDLRMRMVTRKDRCAAAVFGGEVELSLALFAWCKRTVDEHPDIFTTAELLWLYKLVIVYLPKFARIPLRQIDEVAADMAKCYQENGASMRPVFAKLSEVAEIQGRFDKASELWEKALEYPRDQYADCFACELDSLIQSHTLQGRYAEVINEAAPILAGDLRCARVPHCTLPRVMQCLYALGRKEEARNLAVYAYGKVRHSLSFSQELALLIEFHVVEHEFGQAAEMVMNHFDWLQQIRNEYKQFHFLRAVHCLLRALAGTTAHALQWHSRLLDVLEAGCGILEAIPDDQTRLGRVTAAIAAKGLGQALALDDRNGNDYLQRQWHEPPFVVTAP